MTSTSAVSQFFEVACKSKLVTSQQIDELFDDTPPADAAAAAAAMVKAELLTPYQAKQLLGGRFRGFLLGPYKVLKPIGQGGMGGVYLAEHTGLGRKVAVKVLPADKAKDRLALERFQREARAAAALDHPNIVKLFDISHAAGVHFLVMEYVEGNDLQSLMAQTGPLHFGQAAQYVAQAAAGLQHAHDKGFIHRDIKPANLMLTKDGGIKILDMGLARSFVDDKDNLTGLLAEGDIAGTVDFISPEQAMNHPLDERADIYCLGATLFALLAGQPPFNGSTAQKLMQHQMKSPTGVAKKLAGRVPPPLADVIMKMMAKRPSERYQSATEVVDALGPWLPVSMSTGNIANVPRTTPQLRYEPTFADDAPPGEPTAVTRPVAPTRKPIVFVAAGVGLTVLVGAAVAIALAVAGPPKATAPVAAAPPPFPSSFAKADGPAWFRLDLSAQKPFLRRGDAQLVNDPVCDVRFLPRVRTGGGEFPAGFELSAPYGDGFVGEYEAREVDGRMALGVRTFNRGEREGAAMLLAPVVTVNTAKLPVRLTYRCTADEENAVLLKFKPTSPVAPSWVIAPLPAVTGEWKTFQTEIDLKGAKSGYVEIHNQNHVKENWLWVSAYVAGVPPAGGD